MMYDFYDFIKIRSCDNLSFLINIRNNTIFTLKTETLDFLKIVLSEGLDEKRLNSLSPDFINFVKTLEENKILKVNDYEN